MKDTLFFLAKTSRTTLSAKESSPTSSLPLSSPGHLRTCYVSRLPNLSGSSGVALERFTSSIALPKDLNLFLLAAHVVAEGCCDAACGSITSGMLLVASGTSFKWFVAPSEWNEPMSSRIHVKCLCMLMQQGWLLLCYSTVSNQIKRNVKRILPSPSATLSMYIRSRNSVALGSSVSGRFLLVLEWVRKEAELQ